MLAYISTKLPKKPPEIGNFFLVGIPALRQVLQLESQLKDSSPELPDYGKPRQRLKPHRHTTSGHMHMNGSTSKIFLMEGECTDSRLLAKFGS
jgi:hypothetical protein